MKMIWIKALVVFALVGVSTSCSNRDAEKKIAELESRLTELEGKKTLAPAPTPATQPVKDEKPEGPLPKFEFAKTEHDFGTLTEGQVVEYTYEFKNVGDAPLVIQGAQGSCGCTASDWTKTPVPVGGTGYITAKFDSKGQTSMQNKSLTVTANTWPKQTVLRFKAMVTPKGSSVPANGPVRQ